MADPQSPSDGPKVVPPAGGPQSAARRSAVSSHPDAETHIGDLPSQANSANPSSGDDETFVPRNEAKSGAGRAASKSGGPASGELQLGVMIGDRYRILSKLGQGGMGAVYKAQDVKLDRLVAMKVIRGELAADESMMQRFKQELVLARDVTHHNVVRLYDIGEADGVDFITMEFVEGEDLGSVLKRRGKLPAAEAADLVAQMCAGLGAAHARGIIHRDLKPGNIMLDAAGRIVVMDFGLARGLDGSGMTRSGALVGTFEYMSPEQANGAQLDPRSDLYTVGLIFYELLTGVQPFHSESVITSLMLRTRERAKPPTVHDGSIPKAISGICSKCLERAAADRYQSAAELIADIENWKTPAAKKQQAPWKLITVAAAAVAVLAIAATVYLLRPKTTPAGGAHQPITVLVADFTNHTGDSVFDGTLEPMFNLAMEGASFVNGFDRGRAHKLAAKLPKPSETLDEPSSRLIAVAQGISTVITGDIYRRGDGYSVSAKAIDPASGNVLTTAEATAKNKEDVLAKIPAIAVPIRKALGDTTPAAIQLDATAGGFTAASLEAVHENAVAVDEQFAGKYEEALQSFQKAVDRDPNFARAYTGMAAMAQNLGKAQDAEKYMKLAMAHEDRMTDRERYRARGLYYLTQGNWQKCVEEFNQLIARYPVDRVGQNNLATCYTSLRNPAKALEAAHKAVEIEPKGVSQRLNLAFIEIFAGDFAAGEKDAHTVLDMNPAALQGYLNLAEAALGQGQLGAAVENYQKLESNPKAGPVFTSISHFGLADVAAYQGKFGDAARILEQGAAADLAAKMQENAARKYAALSQIELMRGHDAAAVADATKALATAQTVPIKFLAGRAYAEAGDKTRAEKIASALSAELSAEPQAYGKIIAGLVALNKHNAREAIKQISEANNLLDTWIGRFELGRAYLQAGAFTDADSEFDRCSKRRGEVIELFGDNVPTYSYYPYVLYYQGQVRDGLKSAGAADFYRSYLAIRGQSTEDPLVPKIPK